MGEAFVFFLALALNVLEQAQGGFELTVQALAVEAEGGEAFDDAVGVGGFVGFGEGAVCEEIGLEDSDPVEAPGGVGEDLDEVLLVRAEGAEVLLKRSQVLAILFEVFAGQDYELAGESMAQRV